MSTAKTSAGLLLYRIRDGALEVLIAHMGGPLWANKDEGAWSIVKGEYDGEREDAYEAARREFAEETGARPPDGEALELGEIRQRSGKRVVAWAVAGELDPAGARRKLVTGQAAFVDTLEQRIGERAAQSRQS